MPSSELSTRRPTTWEIALYLLAGGGLLAAITMVLVPLRTTYQKRTCQDNLRKLNQALQMYIADNDDTFPPMRSWWDANRTAPKPLEGCPAVQAIPPLKDHPGVTIHLSAIHGYAFNGTLNAEPTKKSNVVYPAMAVCVADQAGDMEAIINTEGSQNIQQGEHRENAALRHNGGANYLFIDGHVQWYPPKAIRGAEEMIVGRERHPDGKTPDFLLK